MMSPRQLTSPLMKESSSRRKRSNLRKAREQEFTERWARKDPEIKKQYNKVLVAGITKLHIGSPILRAAIARDEQAARLEAAETDFKHVRAQMKYKEQNSMMLEDDDSQGL